MVSPVKLKPEVDGSLAPDKFQPEAKRAAFLTKLKPESDGFTDTWRFIASDEQL